MMFCLLNRERREWTAIKYGEWLGLDYKNATSSWKRGTQDLIVKRWMVEDNGELKWGEKIKIFLKKSEK
jgi:hypothetical protein